MKVVIHLCFEVKLRTIVDRAHTNTKSRKVRNAEKIKNRLHHKM